jgi:hypothetical protein
MKDIISRDLFLKVDYEKVKSDSGIVLPGVIFYLIGVLPIMITHSNNKRQVVKLQAREVIRSDDPGLRKMMGARITEQHSLKYKDQISAIVSKFEKLIKSMKERRKFNGLSINDVAVIKL